MVNESEVDFSVLPLASAITTLPLSDSQDEEYIVAIGNTSRYTYIYVGSPSSSFKIAAKLEGQGDWVRALSFSPAQPNGSIMLASGCQDRYIRIWSITPGVDADLLQSANDGTEFLIEENDPAYDESTGQLSNKVYELATVTPYSMKFDALIVGHDDWVYSLKWHPASKNLCLMSSSADSSIMIWTPDKSSGVWLSKTQLGDITIKGASTATGAYGGMWYSTWIGKNYDTIVSLANTGAWKKWTLQGQTENYEGMDIWNAELGISGHTRPVTDVDWSPDGTYLLSTSLDKTTRLYAPWINEPQPHEKLGWYEMARPQIHGYEMISVRAISPGLFVSAGDEKVLRVFSLTKSVATLLNNTVGMNISQSILESASESAAVPALGLSNKAVTETGGDDIHNAEGDAIQETIEEDRQIGTANIENVGIQTDRPPLEDQLQRLTLFPEVEKIYGHGYEVTTIAVPCQGRDLDNYLDELIVLSACKANSQHHAVIRITDTKTWQGDFEPLSHHTLTVTGIEFSQDDKYVLSVSRDRSWSLWERKPETVPLPDQSLKTDDITGDSKGTKLFDLVETNKQHTRIIWGCAWVHLSQPKGAYYFFTASRDKTVKLWSNTAAESSGNNSKWSVIKSVSFPSPVTAVAVTQYSSTTGTHILAAGLDTGDVYIAEVSIQNEVEIQQPLKLPDELAPSGRVNRLVWNPKPESLERNGKNSALLAIASDDQSVRVLRISV